MERTNNSQLLSDAEVSAVKNAYKAFKYQVKKENKWQSENVGNSGDFNHFNILVVDLLNGIDVINQVWGDDVEPTNFYQLQRVFSCYIKTHPDDAEKTLELHSTITRLISKILERRNTVYTLSEMFKLYDEAMGNWDKEKQVFPD